MSTFSAPNYEISIGHEYLHYNCEAPDPDWEFTDSKGHVHRWVQDGDVWSVPTAWFIVDGIRVIDGDAIDYGHSECLECGDTVRPGHRREDRTMPGLIRIEGTVRTNGEFPLGEPLKAVLLGLPFTGRVILLKYESKSCAKGDAEYEYAFESTGEYELNESLLSHSR